MTSYLYPCIIKNHDSDGSDMSIYSQNLAWETLVFAYGDLTLFYNLHILEPAKQGCGIKNTCGINSFKLVGDSALNQFVQREVCIQLYMYYVRQFFNTYLFLQFFQVNSTIIDSMNCHTFINDILYTVDENSDTPHVFNLT